MFERQRGKADEGAAEVEGLSVEGIELSRGRVVGRAIPAERLGGIGREEPGHQERDPGGGDDARGEHRGAEASI